jgi:hypothetical protein
MLHKRPCNTVARRAKLKSQTNAKAKKTEEK